MQRRKLLKLLGLSVSVCVTLPALGQSQTPPPPPEPKPEPKPIVKTHTVKVNDPYNQHLVTRQPVGFV